MTDRHGATDVSSPLPELVEAGDISARFKIPRPTIYELARTGRLPAIEFGRSLRFKVDDVLAYLEANKRTRGIPG